MKTLIKGDYVLATKYSDGDPQDQWSVGFFDEMYNGRCYVVNDSGVQFRGNGFRRCEKITEAQGKYILNGARSAEFSWEPIWSWIHTVTDEDLKFIWTKK